MVVEVTLVKVLLYDQRGGRLQRGLGEHRAELGRCGNWSYTRWWWWWTRLLRRRPHRSKVLFHQHPSGGASAHPADSIGTRAHFGNLPGRCAHLAVGRLAGLQLTLQFESQLQLLLRATPTLANVLECVILVHLDIQVHQSSSAGWHQLEVTNKVGLHPLLAVRLALVEDPTLEGKHSLFVGQVMSSAAIGMCSLGHIPSVGVVSRRTAGRDRCCWCWWWCWNSVRFHRKQVVELKLLTRVHRCPEGWRLLATWTTCSINRLDKRCPPP